MVEGRFKGAAIMAVDKLLITLNQHVQMLVVRGIC